jgi:hypothetical protein
MSETRTEADKAQAAKTYDACDRCSAPVDEGQRYCMACGTRNRRARDPVARYLALASSHARKTKAAPVPGPVRRRGAGIGTAAVIAAIPLAVALGVLVGHAGKADDSKLIAALRAQKPPVVHVTTGAPTAGSTQTAASAATTSTFSLASGYTVELEVLPSAAAAASAERSARARGATALGVIAARDFTITPTPAAGAYVLYSGQYPTRSAAAAALAKLGHRFAGARVIAVRTPTSASQSSGGQAGAPVSKSSLARGAKEVKQLSHATGTGYVQAQNNLPGVVSVP